MNTDKLFKIGYTRSLSHNDVEIFLNEKYNFNIRNVECFTNIGSYNGYQPENIPNGMSFFCKNYIIGETEHEWFERIINLALDLLIKYKIAK
jgi:hypothetical protein